MGAGHRPLQGERVERGQPGQGLRAAVGDGLGAAAGHAAADRRAALDRRRAVPDPHPVERRAGRATGCGRSPPSWPRSSPRCPKHDPGAAHRRPAAGRARRARPRPHGRRRASAGSQLTGALAGGLASGRPAGTAVRDNREMRVEVGPLFRSAEEVGRVVVGVAPGPARLRVRRWPGSSTGPARRRDAVFFAPGPAGATAERSRRNASTRRSPSPSPSGPGANATDARRARAGEARGPAARACCPPTSAWT